MKILTISIFAMCAATAALAQQWEVGGVAGGSFLNTVPASGATAGFASGVVAGGFLGTRLLPHLSGEARYEFFQSDLQLTDNGQTAKFAGRTHALHYDVLFHFNNTESKVQFYAAAGGGVKIFQGTGMEQAYQPLSQYGYFTKTNAIKPMLSLGGGMTIRLSERIALRAELRDMMTGFPTQVLTPAPGVRFGSLLNDVVPMVGIEYVH
jgi:hypothetical protein